MRFFCRYPATDQIGSARKLAVPLRAINGDLHPTDVEAVRRTKLDFRAVILKGTGHYPMLERPEEFTGHVAVVVDELSSKR